MMANFTENYERFGRKSSTFYRLVRKDEYGRYDFYDFHTVINGNMHYNYYERAELSAEGNVVHYGYIGREVRIPSYDTAGKEKANQLYRKLQKQGFKCIGVFEDDICGVSRRIR